MLAVLAHRERTWPVLRRRLARTHADEVALSYVVRDLLAEGRIAWRKGPIAWRLVFRR